MVRSDLMTPWLEMKSVGEKAFAGKGSGLEGFERFHGVDVQAEREGEGREMPPLCYSLTSSQPHMDKAAKSLENF